jgi:hypothetical protein
MLFEGKLEEKDGLGKWEILMFDGSFGTGKVQLEDHQI